MIFLYFLYGLAFEGLGLAAYLQLRREGDFPLKRELPWLAAFGFVGGAAGLKLGMHYCSLENKHTGQIYQQNSGHNFPKRMYFSQKDYFLKTAKVFGEDIPAVQQVFDKSGYREYLVNDQYNYLEFHVNRIGSRKTINIDVGVSLNVIETRNNEPVLRELKVDVTTPQSFRLSTDV